MGGQSDFWPADVEDAANKAGHAQGHPEKPGKYDAVWQQNQVEFLASGHGGVPNMVFHDEPFFGQDRFDLLFSRLRQT